MNKKWLLSYPRSGSNWLKYCIEALTNFEVSTLIDCKKITEDIILKDHGHVSNFWNNYSEFDTIILIVRNYKECITRHIDITNYDELKKEFQNKTPIQSGIDDTDFIMLLDLYDKSKGPKILIYYEDFILNPKKELEKILKFLLNLNAHIKISLNDFLINFNSHKEKSIQYYRNNFSASITRGDKDKLFYHSKKINIEDRKKLDNFLQHEYPDLFKKYLQRYLENE